MCDVELRAARRRLAELELHTACGASREGSSVLAELELHTDCGASREGSFVLAPAKPVLYSMPVEIILNICSFLDADFLKLTFTKVCKRFETILQDNHVWKYWFHSKLNEGVYPALPQLSLWREEPVDWERTCVAAASEKRKWENVHDTMRHIVVKDIHFASVDTVLLVNDGEFCISGGRDRGMALWRVLDVGGGAGAGGSAGGGSTLTSFADAKPHHLRHGAHEGWVWDLAPDHLINTRLVYSASWDNTVKVWDLNAGFTCIETFRCGMSALSVETCGDVVMAGLYSKRVLAFDVRVGARPVASYKPHRGPVLALAAHRDQVASISEDRTLAVWDRRAGRPLVTDVRLPTGKAYPVCVSWTRAALYVGDSKGGLHLLHPERCELLRSHEVWPEPPLTQPACKITGCLQSAATLALCSDRGEIKFLYNSSPPQEFARIHSTTLDVTQMRYQNGILAIGTCDSALEFWVPSQRYPDAPDAAEPAGAAGLAEPGEPGGLAGPGEGEGEPADPAPPAPPARSPAHPELRGA